MFASVVPISQDQQVQMHHLTYAAATTRILQVQMHHLIQATIARILQVQMHYLTHSTATITIAKSIFNGSNGVRIL